MIIITLSFLKKAVFKESLSFKLFIILIIFSLYESCGGVQKRLKSFLLRWVDIIPSLSCLFYLIRKFNKDNHDGNGNGNGNLNGNVAKQQV